MQINGTTFLRYRDIWILSIVRFTQDFSKIVPLICIQFFKIYKSKMFGKSK